MNAYISWAIAALFYFYQYILRVLPANIEGLLRTDFHLTAHEFGSIGSYTIYAYAFMQIPMGILIDRLGIRKIMAASLILCSLGTWGMASAPELWALQLSRILIGIGSASAFMSALKIAADYLPPGRRGLLMGATLTLGTMGAMLTGSYLVEVISEVGWRQLSSGLGLSGIVLAALVLLGVRLPTPASRGETPRGIEWGKIAEVIRNRKIMIYAFLAVGVYTPLSVLGDLWGPAFFMKKYLLSPSEASGTTIYIFAGLSVGSALLPWLCEKWQCLDRAIQLCSGGIFVLFGLLLWGPQLSIGEVKLLLFAVGFFCGAEMMCFTGAVQATTAAHSGLTLGVVNTLNMFGGAALQHIIGYALDLQWSGQLDAQGIRQYEALHYVVALSLLWGIIAACCLLSIRLGQRKLLIF